MIRWISVFVVLLGGCGSSEAPLPTIVSVEPQRLSTSESALLSVGIEGSFPIQVDYKDRLAGLLPLTFVVIGDRRLPVIQTEDQGQTLIVEILPGLPVGLQDVRVEFQDGRQAVRERGFEVTRALDLTGFEFDLIGPQIKGKPFFITVRAAGPDAALFQSRVKVYSNNGTVVPEVTRPFQAGVLTQEITVDNIGPRPVNIFVEDYVGHVSLSNEFQVSDP